MEQSGIHPTDKSEKHQKSSNLIVGQNGRECHNETSHQGGECTQCNGTAHASNGHLNAQQLVLLNKNVSCQ